MTLANLQPAQGSVKKEKKRLGRGEGSGKGGTSTRGNKGAQSRSGYSKRAGFEGGQMPLARRLPKFGFKNISRKEYKAINVDTLQILAEATGLTTIDMNALVSAGLAKKSDKVKILGEGKLTLKLEVKAHAFSKKAIQTIEATQGSVVKI